MRSLLERLGGALRAGLLDQPEGRFDALDGLRGIGMILVIFCHCAVFAGHIPRAHGLVASLMASGWIGLELFFALSGFLIGRILLEQLARGGVRFLAFYLRRSFRIFPMYYLVLTLSVLVFSRLPGYFLVFGSTDPAELARRSVANYLYYTNYVYRLGDPNPLGWGWSLCVEEHFYLLLPVALTLLSRFARGRVRFAVLGAASLLPLAARLVVYARAPGLRPLDGVYYWSHTRADGLLLGVMIADVYVNERALLERFAARLGDALWLGGLGLLAAVHVWGGLFAVGLFPAAFQFSAVALGSAMLVVNGLVADNAATRLLSLPVWRPVARLSYGMYLVHLLVLRWAYARWPMLPLSAAVSARGLLACVAVVSAGTLLATLPLFFMVERPMLELGARLARRWA